MTKKASQDLTPLQFGASMFLLLVISVALFVATAPVREENVMLREQAENDRACTDLGLQNPLTERERADVEAALALHQC